MQVTVRVDGLAMERGEVVSVIGNCGARHASLAEWRACRACDVPEGHLRVPKLWSESAEISAEAFNSLVRR
jgi:hypothetical protein